MAKIGEGMIGEMASLGLQELQNANAGQMAMDAPPIQPNEAPAMDYNAQLDAAAARAPEPVSQELGMER